ncbi:hypothetical protein MTR67_020881 [Solanum verrucosum]|uniref:Replication protein A OB domain-containing protein n=1 Tax=Solanum verrucosum TaxID=315347 RepID=A0AAF0QQH1_SOLVR|nr:hypothetical protein MTR67_020881 [Solanum verrucosum]
MAPRLNIDGITTDTLYWTCKVQIVDMSRDRLSLEKKTRFQNLILEDEQVLSLIVVAAHLRAVVYGDDIDNYAKKLILLDTYLISTASVKVSLPSYGKVIHKFYWVLDKEALIEHVEPDNELEKSLLPPTKLHTTTFASIAHMTPGPNAEIGPHISLFLLDIVGVVLRCGPSKYIGHTQNRCCEVTIANDKRNQFMLTLWDDLGEIEGTELEALMENGKDFPVILGRNIGVSGYQGMRVLHCFTETSPFYTTITRSFRMYKFILRN